MFLLSSGLIVKSSKDGRYTIHDHIMKTEAPNADKTLIEILVK